MVIAIAHNNPKAKLDIVQINKYSNSKNDIVNESYNDFKDNCNPNHYTYYLDYYRQDVRSWEGFSIV